MAHAKYQQRALLWHDRKYHQRCMRRIMIDRVQRDTAPPFLTQWFARIGVDVKAGKVTAGDVKSNTVPTSKDQRRWIHLDREFRWLA